MKTRMVSLKKVMGYAFLLILLIAQSQTLNANNRIRIIDEDDDGGNLKFELVALDDCKLTVDLPFYIANLDRDGLENVLPEGMENIYMHYTIGNDAGSLLVDITDCIYLRHVNGEPIFSCGQSITVDLKEECNSSSGQDILIEWSLHTSDGDLYPIEDYADLGEAFSCMVFIETCAYCSDECGIPPSEPEWARHIEVECCICDKEDPCANIPSTPKDTTNAGGKNRSAFAQNTINPILNVKPNPFQSDLYFDISLPNHTAFGMQIYNASGQLILQQNAVSFNNAFRTSVDTESWPVGIYYLRINSSLGQQIQKIVKTH